MTETNEQIHPIVRELQDLVSLAETSSESIDRLNEVRERNILATLFGGLMVYGGLILAFVISLDSKGQIAALGAKYQIGAGAGAGTLMLAGVYTLYRALRSRERVRHDLGVEREIHGRILSLIDDQMRRLEAGPVLSPVALVTLEIRIRRLYRGEGKQVGLPSAE
ncbi:MAG: hypothetical protein JNM66_05935 [Bryobacterales bacterium]|nr:hypothetical protein [Bryobacterales bacterium]